MNTDTIVAIATPKGRGGIGIIRISGSRAVKVATSISKKSELTPRMALYSSFFDVTGELVDSGLLLYFNAPYSFTGEEVVELQVHGSPIVLDRLVAISTSYGCRIANPGEFSERAFLNGKIDLTQAEAIADLIDASSEASARMAVQSLQGEFSKRINELNLQIIHLRTYTEAAIDFPEEEIDFLGDGVVEEKLADILQQLANILKNATQGVLMREGLAIVIAGKPNAGKSTLINALAGKDVAIVTDIAGTTRDVMREHILIDDIPVHVIDTAGLRESQDKVEIEGIKRAWREVSQADCVLLVVDSSKPDKDDSLMRKIKEKLPPLTPIITVFNKIDKVHKEIKASRDSVYLSAKNNDGITLLKGKIKNIAGFQPAEGLFLARRRHIDALNEANDLLLKGQFELKEHRAGELLAEDLRQAHLILTRITGEFTADDLLGTIFSSFCIGK